MVGYPRLGRRGALMLALAATWAWVAVVTALSNPDPIPGLLHTLLPLPVRVGLWAVAAVVAAVYAPRAVDTVGWVALAIPPVERALSFLVGWVMYLLPVEMEGHGRGWLSAGLYVHMVTVVVICAGWREPPPVEAVLREVDTNPGEG